MEQEPILPESEVKQKTGRFRMPGDIGYVKQEFDETGITRCAVCGAKTEGGRVYCDGCSGEATGDACDTTIYDEEDDYKQ